MRRRYLSLSCIALIGFGAPIETLAKDLCLTSGTSWLVPADFGTPNEFDALGAGGGAGPAKNPGNGRGWGSGGGGGAYAISKNLTLTPGSTVGISIGAGGVKGLIAYNGPPATSPSDGGATYLCLTSSCPLGLADPNVGVGARGGFGGYTNGTGNNYANCAFFTSWNFTCYDGGNGAGGVPGASGGGAAGMPVTSGRSGDGGNGYFNNLIGPFGGGAGGSAGQQGASNGGSAINTPVGGVPGTPSPGGGQGGAGGSSLGPGLHGKNGTLWAALDSTCVGVGGPGGAGGASAANNVGADPVGSGNPDGGTGAGGGSGDLNNIQQPGVGGNGGIHIYYMPTTPPATITSQASVE